VGGRAARALAENAQAINDINVFPVPDGDTLAGLNSSLTFRAGLQALALLPA
jgi:dihydroxyacetone kinase-like predicted kinase